MFFADLQASLIISIPIAEKYLKKIWADAFLPENERGRIWASESANHPIQSAFVSTDNIIFSIKRNGLLPEARSHIEHSVTAYGTNFLILGQATD
jgi:hypothetical protein